MLLQVKNPVSNFLRSALIPELRADISAGAAGNIHFALVLIAAVGAAPFKLSVFFNDLDLAVISAYLAVVALCVKLSIHNVVIYILHNRKYGRNIILHIRNLNIADGSAGRKLLELSFKFKLLERVYRL